MLTHFMFPVAYLSPPVLLGVLLSILDHVFDVVFTEAS